MTSRHHREVYSMKRYPAMKTRIPILWPACAVFLVGAGLVGCDGDDVQTDQGSPRDTTLQDRGPDVDSKPPRPDTTMDTRDATIPDIAAGPPAPVVYGAYGNPGNQICKHLHPPAHKPCHLHTLKWLKDIYGIQLARAPAAEVSKAGKVYRLVEYAEREGPVAIEVWVVGETGAKLANTTVTFCYPVVKGSGTSLTCSANKVAVKVKAQGHADFTMTGSGYTKCGQPGPYAAWIDEPGVPSDKVLGLGMLGGTNHRHVNLLFQRVNVGKPAKNATRCPLVE